MQTVEKVVKFSGMEWDASVEQRVALAVRKRREVWLKKTHFDYNMTSFGLDHSSITSLLQSCDSILDEAKLVRHTWPSQKQKNTCGFEGCTMTNFIPSQPFHRIKGQTKKAGGSKQTLDTNTGQ